MDSGDLKRAKMGMYVEDSLEKGLEISGLEMVMGV